MAFLPWNTIWRVSISSLSKHSQRHSQAWHGILLGMGRHSVSTGRNQKPLTHFHNLFYSCILILATPPSRLGQQTQGRLLRNAPCMRKIADLAQRLSARHLLVINGSMSTMPQLFPQQLSVAHASLHDAAGYLAACDRRGRYQMQS